MIIDVLTNFDKYLPLNKNFKLISDYLSQRETNVLRPPSQPLPLEGGGQGGGEKNNSKLIAGIINTNNLAGLKCGKYELKGNEVFFNLQEYETKPIQKLEAHKKYIDIQIVVKGSEYMGYTDIKNTTVKEEYNAEKDVMFLNGNTDKVKADNTMFIIFYPNDAHMPALCIDKPSCVKKAIFKILV